MKPIELPKFRRAPNFCSLGNMPCVLKSLVWHVGDLDGWRQVNGDMEGPLLSVSSHPDEWRKIAGLGDSPAWRISKQGRQLRFFDAHSIRKLPKKPHLAWAEEAGLLEKKLGWVARVLRPGREFARVVCSTYEEAVLIHDDTGDIQRENVLAMTSSLATFWNQRKSGVWSIAQSNAAEDAVLCVLSEVLSRGMGDGVDGVWWSDRMDPSGYSAPRGGIATGGDFNFERC